MKNKNKKWTEDETESVIKMRRAGKKNREIAEKLGRSTASVSMRIAKLRQKGVDIERRTDSTGAPLGNDFRKGTGNPVIGLQRAAFPRNWYQDTVDKTLEDKVLEDKKNLKKALYKLSAIEEYSQQLERENKALIEALSAANKLIDVYTKRDED